MSLVESPATPSKFNGAISRRTNASTAKKVDQVEPQVAPKSRPFNGMIISPNKPPRPGNSQDGIPEKDEEWLCPWELVEYSRTIFDTTLDGADRKSGFIPNKGTFPSPEFQRLYEIAPRVEAIVDKSDAADKVKSMIQRLTCPYRGWLAFGPALRLSAEAALARRPTT